MSLNEFNLPLIDLEKDPEKLKSRLTARISLGEFFGLAIALCCTLGFTWQHANQVFPFHYDLGNYLNTAEGNFSNYYYGYWFLPVFWLLAKFPFPVAFALWNLANIGGIFYSTRIFGGKPLWVLSGFQMIFTLFQGNITGILALMLAAAWWNMIHKRWAIAGLFLIFACTKYQIGIPFGLLLFFSVPGAWSDKARIAIIPSLVILLSLIIWGIWPLKVLESIRNFPPDAQGSISLWNMLGVFALLIWIPPICLKLPPRHRLTMLICSFYLGLPYLQQNDLLILFSFIPNALSILGNMGYIFSIIRYSLLQFLVFIPLVLYLWIWLDARRLNLTHTVPE